MAGRISLLGRPSAVDARGQPIRWPTKAYALMAYAILDGGGELRRSQAAAFLWEAVEPNRSRANLRELLRRVRDVQIQANVAFVEEDDDVIRLTRPAGLVDLLDLTQKLSRPVAASVLPEICQLYAGDLLAGLDDWGAHFSQWLLSRRHGLLVELLAAVAPKIETAVTQLPPADLVFAANRLIEIDPYKEEAYRALMQLHALRNDRVSVEKIFKRLSRELSNDLGIAPSQVTVDLFKKLSDGLHKADDDKHVPRRTVEHMAAPSLHSPYYLPQLLLQKQALGGTSADGEREFGAAMEELAVNLWRTRAVRLFHQVPETAPRKISAASPFDYRIVVSPIWRQTEPAVAVQLLSDVHSEVIWTDILSIKDLSSVSIRILSDNIVHFIEKNELEMPRHDNESLGAYRQIVAGKRLMRNIDLPSIRRARSLFKSTLSISNNHVGALAGISKAARLEWLLLGREQRAGLEAAKQFAAQAVQSDPDRPEGFHQLGMCEIYSRNFDRGLQLLQKAKGMSGLDTDMLGEYADAFIMAGQAADGLAFIEPFIAHPISSGDLLLWIAASGKYLLEDYKGAISYLIRLGAPETAFHLQAACHAMLGDHAIAKEYSEKVKEDLPDFSIRARLKMTPFSRKIDAERVAVGLRAAGFD